MALDLQTFFKSLSTSESAFLAYRGSVSLFISKAQIVSCPSLTSTQWRAVGVVVVDKVLSSLKCITHDPKFSQHMWEALIDSQASRLKLDKSELFLIRDYFSDIAWKQKENDESWIHAASTPR